MQLQACPTRQQIDLFVKGTLAEEAAALIAAHLKLCSPCLWEIGQPGQDIRDQRRADLRSSGTHKLTPLPFLSPGRGGNELGWLGNYRVLKVLGEGGMGLVLAAEDAYLERPVALKVMKSEVANMPDAKQRFLREAMSMAQLKSAHVVTVHQVGEINDTCFIAMELLEGETLESYLLREAPDLKEALRIAKEIAQALRAAHQKGLIHRDIKPENVFLEGAQRTVKLLDFGLARPQVTNSKLTMTGMIMGTPSYMSPEQAHAKEVDARTDLFSLGCILYQLVTGRKPFDGPTAMSVLISIVEHEPPSPGLIRENVPEALDRLIMSLLAKDPEYRLQSAQDVIAAVIALENEFFEGGDKAREQDVEPQKISGNTMLTNRKEAERRQVTLLYVTCDMFSGSREFSLLDLEDQSTFLSEFHEACNRVLSGYAGTTVQYLQDAIIICFGYPTAYEGMTLLAAGCALSLGEALGQLSTRLLVEFGLLLSPRMSMHSGLCLVESKTSPLTQGSTYCTIIGEPRRVTLEISAKAQPGQIIISDTSRALLKDRFQCIPLGNRLFELKGESSLRLDTVSEKAVLSTGRDLERALILDRWQHALEERGQIILLSGEAGLGKSYLLTSVKTKIQEETPGVCLIELFSAPHCQNSTLHPIIKFFEEILGITRHDSQSQRQTKLVEHLKQLGITDSSKIGVLAKLLHIKSTSKYPSLSLSPSREREEIFEAILLWLNAYKEKKPLLLTIEDLHWLDDSTLELVNRLIDENNLEQRMMVILTYRPEFRHNWPGLNTATSVSLNRLTKQESRRLVQEKAGQALSEDIVSLICERAGGVPLFIEEFTRMFTGIDRLDTSSGSLDLPIPNTVHELVIARLDKMTGSKTLAQTAAAIGRSFKFDLLKSISQLDEASLKRELGTLIQNDLLQIKGEPPQAVYTFKHLLYQDALYNTLTKSKRQNLHRQIAEALVARNDDDSDKRAEVLAFHFAEAGLIEASIKHWLLAGKVAQSKFAIVEAIRHYSAGLEMLERLPLSEDPLKKEKLELDFLVPLGNCYQIVMGYSAPVVGPIFARAKEICHRIGDSEELFIVMWGIWTWHLVRGDLNICLELAEDLLTYALREQIPGMIMEAHVAFAASSFYQGNFELSRRYAEEAILIHEDKTIAKRWCLRTGQNATVVIRCYLALSLFHLGNEEKAFAVIVDALNLARSFDHPFSLVHALHFAALLSMSADKRAEWQEFTQEQIALSAQHGFALWEATGMFFKGALLSRSPQTCPKGLEEMEESLQLFRATGAMLTLPMQLCCLAKAYREAEMEERAHELLDEAYLLMEKSRECQYQAKYHSLKGELAKDEIEARQELQNSLLVARTQKNLSAERETKEICARLNIAV